MPKFLISIFLTLSFLCSPALAQRYSPAEKKRLAITRTIATAAVISLAVAGVYNEKAETAAHVTFILGSIAFISSSIIFLVTTLFPEPSVYNAIND